MRVKLDENLGTLGIEVFRKYGHDKQSVVGHSMQSLSSAIAGIENAVVEIGSLEHNVDFIVTENLSDFAEWRVPARAR